MVTKYLDFVMTRMQGGYDYKQEFRFQVLKLATDACESKKEKERNGEILHYRPIDWLRCEKRREKEERVVQERQQRIGYVHPSNA